jgi:hypothetical protein
LFEVEDQAGGAAGHAGGERAVVAFDVLVGIPVAAGEPVVVAGPDLDVAHAAFEEAAGDEAFPEKCRFPRRD